MSNGNRLADYNVLRAGGGFDVGYNFGRFSEVRAGIEVAHLRGEVEVGFPTVLPNARGTEQILTGRWRLNALNSGAVPTDGFLIESEANWNLKTPRVFFLGQDVTDPGRYGQAWSQIIYARSLLTKWSGLLRASGGGTFAGEAQPFSEFRLGGPMRLSSLEVGELRGANFAYGSASILRRVYSSPTSAISKVYGMLSYETGDAFNSRPSFTHNGTAGIMAETGVGVLSAGFSYGEHGRYGLFFSLGRVFDGSVRNFVPLR